MTADRSARFCLRVSALAAMLTAADLSRSIRHARVRSSSDGEGGGDDADRGRLKVEGEDDEVEEDDEDVSDMLKDLSIYPL